MLPLSEYIWDKSKSQTIALVVLLGFTLSSVLLALNYKHKVDVLKSLTHIIAEQTSNKMKSGEWPEVIQNAQKWRSDGLLSFLEVRYQSEVLIGPLSSSKHFFNVCSQVRSQFVHIYACAPVLRQDELILYSAGVVLLLLLASVGISILRKKTILLVNQQMNQLSALTMSDVQEIGSFKTNIQEFAFVEKKFQSLIDEAGRNSRAIEKWSNARRFAHDVRYLVDLIGDNTVNASIKSNPLDALSKIKTMAYSYLGGGEPNKIFVDPCLLIDSWAAEARSLHQEVVIEVLNHSNSGYVLIPPHELRSILWNSLKNSIEASNQKQKLIFQIQIEYLESFLQIIISDNAGCSSDVVERLNERKYFTGKPSGYGIGVKSLVEVVERFGGEVFFLKKNGSLSIELRLMKLTGQTSTKVIHLDDDKYTRNNWTSRLKKAGIPTLSLESFAQLQETKDSISKRDVAFVDIELNAEVNGIDAAKYLSRIGVQQIYLTTSYTADEVSAPCCVLGILGKEVPI